jgi:hypothetical protein
VNGDAKLYRRKPSAPVSVQRVAEQQLVETPSGVTIAEPGDFIVQRSPTDSYVVKPETFAELYEPAEVLAGNTALELEPGNTAAAAAAPERRALAARVEPDAIRHLRSLGHHNAATLLGEILAELTKE